MCAAACRAGHLGSAGKLGIGVAQLGQIGRTWSGVEFGQQTVLAWFSSALRDATLCVIDIAERNGLRRAQLDTSGNDFAVADRAVFFFGVYANSVDALNAVGAFFHDAAIANRDVRVIEQFEAGCVVIGVLEEVKAPHFIRTVIRTVSRAHTAVVDHVIQALITVGGCPDRTDDFTRRIFALHAGYGLMVGLRVIQVAGIIPVYAYPVHLAAGGNLLFADYGNIIFRLAGDSAGVTTNARVQVYGHAPGIAIIAIGRMHAQLGRRIMGHLLREVGMLPVFGQGARPDERPALHIGMILSTGQGVCFARLADFKTAGGPQCPCCPQRVGVEADACPHAACSGASVTQMNSDRLVHVAGRNPDRCLDAVAVETQLDHIFIRDTELLSHMQAHKSGVILCQLGEWFGQFLQPAIIGKSAVPDGRIGLKDEIECRLVRISGFSDRRAFGPVRQVGSGCDRLGWKCAPDNNAVVQRRLPKRVEIGWVGGLVVLNPVVTPVILNNIVAGTAGLIKERNQQFMG